MLYGAIAASDLRFVPVARATFIGVGRLTVDSTLYNPVQVGSANFSGIGAVTVQSFINFAATDAFLARTSGLDATHVSAYRALINGLNVDGVWAKLDGLWVFATQDVDTAKLSLVSATLNMTASATPPTFTADQGFTGDGTHYLDCGVAMNALSLYGADVNGGHIMSWDLTTGGSVNRTIGNSDATLGKQTHIHPKYSDNNAYYRINYGNFADAVSSTTKGCDIASRISSTTVVGYKNGSQVVSDNRATPPGPISTNHLTVPEAGANASTDLIAAASVGGTLTGTDASKFYTRLYTYLQAVGVSSPT